MKRVYRIVSLVSVVILLLVTAPGLPVSSHEDPIEPRVSVAGPCTGVGEENTANGASRVRINKITELLENGLPAFGIFASDISTRRAASLASTALDFAISDMEHSPLDMTRLEAYLLAMTDKRRILEKGKPAA